MKQWKNTFLYADEYATWLQLESYKCPFSGQKYYDTWLWNHRHTFGLSNIKIYL